MPGRRSLVALGAFWMCSSAALADPYDLNLARLGNPSPGSATYSAGANANFRAMAMELAGALNSTSLMPPGSLGYSGFAVAAELGVAAIPDQKVFLPTQGNYASPMLLPAVHFRKGLPYSFELGGKVAWLEKSRMVAATLEVRWAFLEGFTYLPDIAVRGHVTRLVNSRELSLTTGGVDLTVGKRFPVAGSVNFIPYAGYNLAFVSAETGAIDFNPGRDPNAALASPSAALADTGVFSSPGPNVLHRFYVGVRFSAGIFRLGVEGSITVFGNNDVPDPANPGTTIAKMIPVLPAFGSTVGLSF